MMDAGHRLRIEAECLRLTHAFFVLSDRGEANAYAELYCEDGTFTRPGLTAMGRAQIAEAILQRPPQLVMRHLGINALIDVIDERTAKGRGSHMLLLHNRETGITELPQVGDFTDSYALTPQGWRIASRVVVGAF